MNCVNIFHQHCLYQSVKMCSAHVYSRGALLEQSFEITDGHPQLTFTCQCWKWECVQNLYQMHQKTVGLGCILHVLDYWESIAHKYDSLWRQSLIPQLFGATDINFEHIPTFSIGKWMSTEGVHLWFQNFVPKLPSYYIGGAILIQIDQKILRSIKHCFHHTLEK